MKHQMREPISKDKFAPACHMTQMITITGGNGFLGRALVAELAGTGEELRLLSRKPPQTPGPAEWQQLDLVAASKEECVAALEGTRVLFHLAGLVSYDPADGPFMMKLHVEGTRLLLDAALEARVERVILLSTSGTVGVSRDANRIADDDSAYATDHALDWPYYASKIYQEKLAFAWARKHGRELIALRPSLVIGPGDFDLSSSGEILKFLKNEMPAIPAGGISFVDVRDVARACKAAAEVALDTPAGQPRSYLLGAINLTLEELTERLARISGVRAPRLKAPAGLTRMAARAWGKLGKPGGGIGPLRSLDPVAVEMAQYFWYIDSSRAREELGWRPRPVDETLADTVKDLQGRM